MATMMRGLFITGTDTDVGKTYVTALIAKQIVSEGRSVGVYKPAASGCNFDERDDPFVLWEAAGKPAELKDVCPQQFAAPLAPHLAARAENKEVDAKLLRYGLDFWRDRYDIVLVEGLGGLMSPVTDDEFVADLAFDFGFPLIVVARNSLGVINQTLQTLITAATFRDGLGIAGIVLNYTRCGSNGEDQSQSSNREELAGRCVPPVLAEVRWNACELEGEIDWWELAR